MRYLGITWSFLLSQYVIIGYNSVFVFFPPVKVKYLNDASVQIDLRWPLTSLLQTLLMSFVLKLLSSKSNGTDSAS